MKIRDAQAELNRRQSTVLRKIDQRDAVARVIYDECRRAGIEELHRESWAKLNIIAKSIYLRIAMKLNKKGHLV